ncbi:hypothetical protein ACQEV4_34865 [Streptomyces shenzhenensis]|uniref:hypothetical protein n=1 Tax=Streptomyces shenzhenensis TaxID=943815 RepID=UPI003D8DD2E6
MGAQILEAVADSVSGQVDLSMSEDGRDRRTALRGWAVSRRAALRDRPDIVRVLARGAASRRRRPRRDGRRRLAARAGHVHRRGACSAGGRAVR